MCAEHQRTDFEVIEEQRSPSVQSISEVCIMAGITDNDEAEIPTLAALISAQSTNTDCFSAFSSFGKVNNRSTVDSDDVFL